MKKQYLLYAVIILVVVAGIYFLGKYKQSTKQWLLDWFSQDANEHNPDKRVRWAFVVNDITDAQRETLKKILIAYPNGITSDAPKELFEFWNALVSKYF